MKKYIKLMSVPLVSMVLISCGQTSDKTDKKEEASQVVSHKKEITSHKKKSKTIKKQVTTQSREKTSVSPERKEEPKKEINIDYDQVYQDILMNYAQSYRLKMSENQKAYLESLSNFEGDAGHVMTHFYDTPVDSNLVYDYIDINHDGKKELVVGLSRGVIYAVYFLQGNQPKLAAAGGVVASHGGARSNLNIYDNGKMVTTSWKSTKPDVYATSYEIMNDQLITATGEFSLAEKQTERDVFNLPENKLDPQLFNWKELPQLVSENKESTDVDVEAILNGDFSSVAGTWQNGEGRTMVFDNYGIVNDYVHVQTKYAKITSGILNAGIVPNNPGPAGGALLFLPPGTVVNDIFEHMTIEDPSDISKARIWSGQSMPQSNDEFYYKID